MTFLSHSWCGRVSDKGIIIESNFLDYLNDDDSVVVDGGVLIEGIGNSESNINHPFFHKI